MTVDETVKIGNVRIGAVAEWLRRSFDYFHLQPKQSHDFLSFRSVGSSPTGVAFCFKFRTFQINVESHITRLVRFITS